MPRSKSNLSVRVYGLFGNVELRYRCRGKAFDLTSLQEKLLFTNNLEKSEEVNAAMQGVLEKIFGDSLSISNNKGVNKVTQKAVSSPYSSLAVTLLALVLGIITGLAIQKLLPAEVSKTISGYVFTPIYTVFMNALKMIVAPLVFFIAASISEFSDLDGIHCLKSR